MFVKMIGDLLIKILAELGGGPPTELFYVLGGWFTFSCNQH